MLAPRPPASMPDIARRRAENCQARRARRLFFEGRRPSDSCSAMLRRLVCFCGIGGVYVIAGCRGAPPPKSVDLAALRSACSHETAWGESDITLYEDPGGRAQRIAVTPDPRRFADYGRAVFDGDGRYLADEPTTGGEVVDDSVQQAQQAARDKLIPPTLKPREVGQCGDY